MKLTSCCDPQFHEYLEWPPIWLNRLSLFTSQCGVRFFIIILALTTFNYPITLNSLRRVPSYTILSLELYHIVHHQLVDTLLLVLHFLPMLLFLHLLLISLFHTQYFASFYCIIKKQLRVRSADYLQVRLVLLPHLKTQHRITFWLYLKNVFIFIIYSLVGVKGRVFITDSISNTNI